MILPDNYNPQATDAWIDALMESGVGRNDRCPCGCNKKFKKITDADLPDHEAKFVAEYASSLSPSVSG